LQSIDYNDWKNYFTSKVKELFSASEADNILKKVDWDTWIYSPGLPPIKNDFSNKYQTEAESRVNDIFDQKPKDDFEKVFVNWNTNVKLVFLGMIKQNLNKLTEENYIFMRDTLNLHKLYNSEIKNIWYQIALNSKHSDVVPYVKAFLANIGRMKYIRPVYSSFAKLDKEDAYNTFQAYKNLYHPVAVRLIENDFKNLALLN
jgi:leukotriene-A4 hydrolase